MIARSKQIVQIICALLPAPLLPDVASLMGSGSDGEEPMFEEAQLYAPVTHGRRRQGRRPARRRPPRLQRPRLPRAAQRHRRTRARVGARRADPARGVHRRRARGLAHRLPRARPKHRKYAVRRATSRRRSARACPPTASPSSTRSATACEPLTGFRYLPAAGLVPLREFYGSLADSRSTPRSTSATTRSPLYTPEPDVVHEVIGHGNALADAAVRRALPAGRRGRAPGRDGRRRCEFFSKVFWFTMEFGVVWRGRRAEGLRRRHPLLATARSRSSAAMEIRPLDSPRWAR